MKTNSLKSSNPVTQEIFDDPYKMRYYNLLEMIKNLIQRLKK